MVVYARAVAKSLHTIEHEKLQALLRQMRIDANLRQADLAKRIGQPQSFVSKYEAGERRLDLVQLHQLCEALGVPLQELTRRFEEIISEA